MTTIRAIIAAFLDFEGINKAYIAEQLYGKRGPTWTSKLRRKHLGIEGRSFTDAEIDRLMQIRKEFHQKLL
ncbi:hypothetical protein [Spirosoma areae]